MKKNYIISCIGKNVNRALTRKVTMESEQMEDHIRSNYSIGYALPALRARRPQFMSAQEVDEKWQTIRDDTGKMKGEYWWVDLLSLSDRELKMKVR